MSALPLHRTIVAVDIEGSTARNNSAKAKLRDDMYAMLEEALLESDVTEDVREPFYDRGDGALLLVHPSDQVPKTSLLTRFIPSLNAKLDLARHGFRLRAAIHAGEVHFDRRGTFGEDIDITFRLLDAPALKSRLRRTTENLVLAVSDQIHHSIIRHGYDGIDDSAFEPLIDLCVAGLPYRGWVHVPGEANRRLRVS